jgi:molybdopterin/thiamine biosynthesis adenylyltransferase
MTKKFIREAMYRGEAALQKLQTIHVTIAGAGTLGSNLAETLSRQGFQNLRLIDMDRVEEPNLGTQIYAAGDLGALKVDAARNIIFRNVETEIETFNKELTSKTIKKFLKKTDLVIDAFDNHDSRQLLFDYCRENSIACLHAGLFEGYGEIVWNDVYNVPGDVEGDVCDYPLARNLAMLVVSIAAEEIVDFASAEQPRRESWSITLGDLAIKPYC